MAYKKIFLILIFIFIFISSTSLNFAIVIKVENDMITTVNSNIYGTNIYPSIETENKIVNFAKNIGLTLFRFPGGGAPGYHWENSSFDYLSQTNPQNCLSNIDDILNFAKNANGEILYQVNIETGTPQEAVKLLQYIKENNYKITYWELGNEVFGNWDNGNFHNKPKEYAELIKDYSNALKSIDPNIKIGADMGGSYYGDWDSIVIKEAGDYIDFLSYHWYSGRKSSESTSNIMGNYPKIEEDVKRFRKIIEEEKPDRVDDIEIGYLEWDTVFRDSSMRDTLANAIAYTDSLAYMAINNLSLANHYSFQEGDAYWNYKGYGLIPGWNTRCNFPSSWGDPRNPEREWEGEIIKPKAFAIKLMANYFTGDILSTKVIDSPTYSKSSGNYAGFEFEGQIPYVSSYSSIKNGKLNLILTNKHSSNNYKLDLKLPFNVNSKVKKISISGNSLTSKNNYNPDEVQYNEGTINFDINDKFNLEPHSIILLQFDIDEKNISINLNETNVEKENEIENNENDINDNNDNNHKDEVENNKNDSEINNENNEETNNKKEDKDEKIKSITNINYCVENWKCTNWTKCIGEKKNRDCKDLNNCGTKTNKPRISLYCSLDEDENEIILSNSEDFLENTSINSVKYNNTVLNFDKENIKENQKYNFNYYYLIPLLITILLGFYIYNRYRIKFLLNYLSENKNLNNFLAKYNRKKDKTELKYYVRKINKIKLKIKNKNITTVEELEKEIKKISKLI